LDKNQQSQIKKNSYQIFDFQRNKLTKTSLHTKKNLKKNYLTWVFHNLGSNTRLLSSHTSMKVLENYYINLLLLNVEEEKLMKVKVFG
jgi:hypothetical protein